MDGEKMQALFCSGYLSKGYTVFLSTIYIFLSIATVLGNVVILAALRKESSLNSPSKLLYLVLFSLYSSLFWELKDKRNLKNLQFWPESLGATLEYWYIERGLFSPEILDQFFIASFFYFFFIPSETWHLVMSIKRQFSSVPTKIKVEQYCCITFLFNHDIFF